MQANSIHQTEFMRGVKDRGVEEKNKRVRKAGMITVAKEAMKKYHCFSPPKSDG